MKNLLVLLFIAFILLGCEEDVTPFSVTNGYIELVVPGVDFKGLKSSATIKINPIPEKGGLTFASEDPYIATMDGSVIHAHHSGKVYIIISAGGYTIRRVVEVLQTENYPVEPILDFSISKNNLISKLENIGEVFLKGDEVLLQGEFISHSYLFTNGKLTTITLTWDDKAGFFPNIIMKERYEPYNDKRGTYVDRDNSFTIKETISSHIYNPILH